MKDSEKKVLVRDYTKYLAASSKRSKPKTQRNFRTIKRDRVKDPQPTQRPVVRRPSRPRVQPTPKKRRLAQKYVALPLDDDPVRLFYQTLLQQNPQSAMALRYCTAYGLIDASL